MERWKDGNYFARLINLQRRMHGVQVVFAKCQLHGSYENNVEEPRGIHCMSHTKLIKIPACMIHLI